MIYLALYVVFSSVFTLCIKWVHVRGREDIITAGAINYIAAAILIAIWFFIDGQQTGDPAAMWLGGTMGTAYFVNFFFVIWCIRVVGASSTTVVGVLSMLMPIIFAAIVWNSVPQVIQIAGIGLALVSLILIGLKPDRQKSLSDTDSNRKQTDAENISVLMSVSMLGSFFILCGVSRIVQEAFKFQSDITQKPTFLLAAFVAAGIPSIVALIGRRRTVLPMELVIGLIMGIANASQTWLTLKALDAMEGFIFFPVSSAGGIIFTMFVAMLFLHERVSKRAFIGIAVAVIALVLMNATTENSSEPPKIQPENSSEKAGSENTAGHYVGTIIGVIRN